MQDWNVGFVTFVLVGCKAAPLSLQLFQAYAVGTALSYAATRPETRVRPRADSCTLDFFFRVQWYEAFVLSDALYVHEN